MNARIGSLLRIFCSFVILTAVIFLVSVHVSGTAFGAKKGAVVDVDDVEELYAAVNDPNNAGATIQLAPGTYILSSNNPNGVPRPNQGRLILPFGMSLQGQNEYVDLDGDGVWDPRDDNGDGFPDLDAEGRKVFADPVTATVIDATDLLVPLNTGAFIEARSVPNSSVTTFQSIKNLTLWGNHTPRSGIIVQAAANSSLNMVLANCTVGLLSRGIQVDARLAHNDHNSTLDVTIEGNVFCYNNPPGGVFGMAMQSLVARVSNHESHLGVRDNRFFDNKIHLYAVNFAAQNSQQVIESKNNIYEESLLTREDLSILESFSSSIVLGLRVESTDNCENNLVEFNSKRDRIWNNGGSLYEGMPTLGAGLRVSINRASEAARTVPIVNNEIRIALQNTLFVKLNEDGTLDGLQNREITEPNVMKRRDIRIEALEGVEALPELTSGNRINIDVKGAISSLTPTDYDPNPEPLLIINDNVTPDQVDITIDGSPEDFLLENTGLNVPDESLFSHTE